MEAYESARLEVITFDEDVITASATVNGCYQTNTSDGGYWTVYYDNGTNEVITGIDKPEVCP